MFQKYVYLDFKEVQKLAAQFTDDGITFTYQISLPTASAFIEWRSVNTGDLEIIKMYEEVQISLSDFQNQIISQLKAKTKQQTIDFNAAYRIPDNSMILPVGISADVEKIKADVGCYTDEVKHLIYECIRISANYYTSEFYRVYALIMAATSIEDVFDKNQILVSKGINSIWNDYLNKVQPTNLSEME